MIITPKELQSWIKQGKNFTVFDVRPKKEIKKNPLSKLDSIAGELEEYKEIKGIVVLVCQIGLVTESMIIQNELFDTYSLLGGVEAWTNFIKEKNDLSRWSRQTILDEIGFEGQKKIMNSNVTIIGMGGLGCPAACSLVASGLGTLKIIDGDKIEVSNLHRQHLFRERDIGKKKVLSAKKRLESLSEHVSISAKDIYLNEENGYDLIKNSDIIIDASDNIATRFIIDKLSKKKNIPLVYGALYKFEGHVSIFNVNGSKGYSELFPGTAISSETCNDAGILGMMPSIIGNMQALETIKLIVGIQPNLVGKLMLYNGLLNTTQIIEL